MKKISLTLAALFLFSLILNAQAANGFTKIANSSAVSFTDTGCPNLSVCYYQLTTVDSSGFESQQATCSGSAICIGGNTAIVMMPSSGVHTVSLTWIASPASGVTYNIYRHIGPLPATGFNAVVN